MRGPWGSGERTQATWYQPLEEKTDIERAVHFVLGRGDVFLNTVGDINILPTVLGRQPLCGVRPQRRRDVRDAGRAAHEFDVCVNQKDTNKLDLGSRR